MPSVFLKTYGCQMNERDSEQVARSLLDRGYQRASSEKEADVILLNTCSVRDLAEQKALRKMMNLRALRKKNPEVVLGFLGCMAQRKGESLEKEMKGLDLVVGTQKFHRVADLVDQARVAAAAEASGEAGLAAASAGVAAGLAAVPAGSRRFQ
jgi:tRNA-2-methylthio-N6-dimethylallyladenosine synthase